MERQHGTPPEYEERIPEKKPRFQWSVRSFLLGAWSAARVIVIFLCSLMIVAAVFLFGYQYFENHYIKPEGAQAAPPQQVVISKGMSLNSIAKMLEDKKLVRSGQAFKFLVDFSGYGDKIKAGSYVLDGSMTLQQIMDKLALGQAAREVTTFTITEGSTIEQMAAQLKNQKIITDTKKFLELCKTGKDFTKYAFVKDAINTANSSKRFYLLEGYLFPAKYEVYVGSTEQEIIDKMLAKTDSVLSTAYRARASAQNMTLDQVLTLAAIIEKEGTPGDFAKISAVFYNRLQKKIALGSDPTVAYALHKTGFITTADTSVDSLYNTYKNKGLPLGPICAPSEKAMEAALYPDEQYMKDGYLYFYLTNPDTGVIEYYKNQKDFEAGIKKYKPIWDAYKKAHGG